MKILQEKFLKKYNNIKEDQDSSKIENIKTGVVYHEDMLKHRIIQDDEKCKKHVENPHRLISIINYLETNKILENCEVQKEMEEIEWIHVENIHGSRYGDYLKNLWKENDTNFSHCVVDTYYNKDSLRAARLAAEATRIASEKVFLNQWNNAFSIVRPPGHHAGVEEKIGGFCFLNNVGISAEYLIRKYGVKKIVVLDWDVHHGDSTQKLFYERKDVLYISIHKYCDGSFYPGKSGAVTNEGVGEGLGFNLNFPINPIHEQYVGDEEYIFTFERMILPIIKSYAPEMVFISCGFDCLKNDPIGKFKVTANSLGHMLYKIKNLVTSKINVVLEGGYNLEEISKASEVLLQILKGDYFLSYQTFYRAKFHSEPLLLFYYNFKENLKIWEKHWGPELNTEDLLYYERKIQKRIEGKCVGGHSDDFEIDEKRFKKKTKENELIFYREIYKKIPRLHSYLPRFFGIIEKNQKIYVELENLNPRNNYNVMDLKLQSFHARRLSDSEFSLKTKTGFVGYNIKNKQNIMIEKRRFFLQCVSYSECENIFIRFFQNHRKKIHFEKMEKLLDFIDNIMHISENQNLGFNNCSLLILHDPDQIDLIIKIIDFNYFTEEKNQNLFLALRNLKSFVKKIIEDNKLDF